MHDNARLVQGMLDGMFRTEDLANLLECAAPCFHEEEVDAYEFEYVPEDEQEIVL